MSLRSEMMLDAKLIMREGLLRTNPSVVISDIGYVETWKQNLLPEIDTTLIENDFRSGKGSELDRKFCAAHSSAALVVNALGPFRDGAQPFLIPGWGEAHLDKFERTFPTGVAGRIPPHLDASARGPKGLVAIESKCLEYFTSKPANFSLAYRSLAHLSDNPWFIEMERLRTCPTSYNCLDAAQLVKHAFGLLNSGEKCPTLLYLFWEPDDAANHDLFAQHRTEIDRFEAHIRDGGLSFTALSYTRLWDAWLNSSSVNLRHHAERLRVRYSGRLRSYEGYTRKNGRKVDASFFGDID